MQADQQKRIYNIISLLKKQRIDNHYRRRLDSLHCENGLCLHDLQPNQQKNIHSENQALATIH